MNEDGSKNPRHTPQALFIAGIQEVVRRSSIVFFFPFPSLRCHNHVDDYSGTLGGVRKVHISALVTSP